MNKLIIFSIVLMILFSFGCTQTTTTATDINLGDNFNPAPNHPLQTYTVSIKNFTFSPATLTINQGDTIIWTNEDSMDHTVKSIAKQYTALNSDPLHNGQTYSQTFNMPETIDYICSIHPSMKGKVIVQ